VPPNPEELQNNLYKGTDAYVKPTVVMIKVPEYNKTSRLAMNEDTVSTQKWLLN
jgi:hypothetical protein